MHDPAAATPLRVLTISTLFPHADKPNFGIFVERSLTALMQQPNIQVTVVAPVGLPPWPLSLHPRYSALRRLPARESWHGIDVRRPRFTLLPGMLPARNSQAIARSAANAIAGDAPFDIILAEFLHPDGDAARRLGEHLALPFAMTARGSDVMIWAKRADTGPQISGAAHQAAGILSVAAALTREMMALGYPEARIHLQRTGVDASRFRPLDRRGARDALGLAPDADVICSIGSLDENKGHHLLIDALTSLPGARLLIAGIGPDQQQLQRQAEALGVADRVRLLGSVPHNDLPQLLNAADVMALPSAREGLANAWVEAMACGTPVLAADIPNAYEAIETPQDGRIVKRDVASIAEGLAAMLAQKTTPLERDALAARTHARFNWQHHAQNLASKLRGWAAR